MNKPFKKCIPKLFIPIFSRNHVITTKFCKCHSTTDIEYPIFGMLHPSSDISPISDFPHPTSYIPHGTWHMAHGTWHIPHPTSNIPHPTSHIHRDDTFSLQAKHYTYWSRWQKFDLTLTATSSKELLFLYKSRGRSLYISLCSG